MYCLDDLKQKIATELKLAQPHFSYPPNIALGDFSLACFDLAAERKQTPVALAQELALSLKDKPSLKDYFVDIKAVGPYLNFFVDPAYLAATLIKAVNSGGANYGVNKTGNKQKVMIEYSNGNTHKEYHVGHLRNISYGDAVSKLLAANGYQAIPVSYINDFGIHTAKTIWNWRRNPVYSERLEPKGYLLGRCYSEASKLLVDNEDGKLEVGQIMKDIESRRGENYKTWQKTRQWSIDYFASIYRELGIKFVDIFYENEFITEGRKLVDKFLADGILKRSQGTIIADLEEYKLGVLPIIRSDGTALYPVADLALASAKFGRYKLDKSIYVVDIRQSLYFKQLFKILEFIGYQQPLIHLTYDFVTLPEGMMSSRTGTVITYQDLRDKVLEKSRAETLRRHPDWSAKRIESVASKLMIATIKFEMLKVGAEKIITFNIQEALRFDGYTACYIEYAYARLQSILRKQKFSFWTPRPDYRELKEEKEKALLIKLARYPEIITQAGLNYDPSELAKYLFELVQMSNDYYHEVNILKSEKKVKIARLALIKTVSQVLNNGLKILGLESLEEM
ncbi:arginine--tRNA ligase [Candidatus Falkowbacteria bacterium]|uniref:Arginine--tRNA ligase n=1 Tax=Candidatus Falkowbacteria bacterium CG10_big_fil_rev_8_21_14_0_10_37_18 TaxID=1974562 RepID=A0A2H0V8A7_9BACT|nr:arginine--tRNA ligase [Candidatus Falkowbacteria bacterium]NCQ12633.1 arginine--tRNA ligase [Candidatus Falkowbacteria bacterium]PIR95301.1 MAG: arginine--tRNA ligase [Candidatus Falkowbacteria bacterium CG10_big_fil_rev_8_21_14_0_10_37_18]